MTEVQDAGGHEKLPEPIMAPIFHAASVAVHGAPNEIAFVFSRGRPLTGTVNGEQVLMNEPQCILSLSPLTAKDLLVVLQDVIASYEETLGPISTAFSKDRQGKKD